MYQCLTPCRSVSDWSDPAMNIRIGSAIFRGYIDEADGEVEAALTRYSGGVRGYVRRVTQYV